MFKEKNNVTQNLELPLAPITTSTEPVAVTPGTLVSAMCASLLARTKNTNSYASRTVYHPDE